MVLIHTELSFIMGGGTCLTEMLEEGLKEIKIFDNSDILYDEI